MKDVKEYLVSQLLVREIVQNGFNPTIKTSVVVLRVFACSKEEAIGKFVLHNKDLERTIDAEIECYPMENLKTIN